MQGLLNVQAVSGNEVREGVVGSGVHLSLVISLVVVVDSHCKRSASGWQIRWWWKGMQYKLSKIAEMCWANY